MGRPRLKFWGTVSPASHKSPLMDGSNKHGISQ